MSTVIRVNQIKLDVQADFTMIRRAVIVQLGLGKLADKGKLDIDMNIAKRSLDARHKPQLYYVYSVDVKAVTYNGERQELKKLRLGKNASIIDVTEYSFATYRGGELKEKDRPVIIGFGPAGMFAALKLAENGLRPIVYERGSAVDERKSDVTAFWNTGALNANSNVQFGEGGAGTFSDGKLNTGVKDPSGRIRDVLKTFVHYGASEEILYNNKPHIGTDVLEEVVVNIRKAIIAMGGEVFFNHCFMDYSCDSKGLTSITIKDLRNNKTFVRECSNVCLALGHSARDTFTMLNSKGMSMVPKAFAVGVRMVHPQDFINHNAYGDYKGRMPAADYKVTYQTSLNRGVYSFCMCPGGYVVNASSEEGMLAVNGMSYSKRDSDSANSAIIVTVTPDDFGHGVLDGMSFQRRLESCAYRAGNGNIPVQLLADFKENVISSGFGRVVPCVKGRTSFANLNEVLPSFIADAIKEGVDGFDRLIKGFNMEDSVLLGVESRTSSPVKIIRDELYHSSVRGIFPCGEGAGYAGGITSAAVDGIKTAEMINDFLSDMV